MFCDAVSAGLGPAQNGWGPGRGAELCPQGAPFSLFPAGLSLFSMSVWACPQGPDDNWAQWGLGCGSLQPFLLTLTQRLGGASAGSPSSVTPGCGANCAIPVTRGQRQQGAGEEASLSCSSFHPNRPRLRPQVLHTVNCAQPCRLAKSCCSPCQMLTH